MTILKPEQEILTKYGELQQTATELGQELANLRKIAENSRTPEQQQRITQLVNLQEDLNRQFNDFADSDEVIALIDQLSRTAQRQNLDIADLAALQENLGTLNAALLYPLILEDRLELVITTPNSPPLRRSVPVKREDLNRAISQFREQLRNVGSNPIPTAQKFYDWLILECRNSWSLF